MPSIWSKAAALAAATPPSRNRAVDFLRAVSIVVVVIGHWMMASPWVDQDGSHMGHMLTWAPVTHYLTWIFQVMPIFFFVGGYSNGITWDAAVRKGTPYREWLYARLRRLLKPVLVLTLFWPIAGAIAFQSGVPSIYIEVASQVALIPVWFLAVYSLMVALAPAMRTLWKRFGLVSLWVLLGLTIVGDTLYFGDALPALGWWNYLTLWLAVHQLGFVWLDRRITANWVPWLCFLAGVASLLAFTSWGPWPTSMIGVPGEKISNSTPPHLPLLSLAAIQFGLVLLLEERLQNWLMRGPWWTATVLISSMIMTVFLWHSTVMMLSYGAGFLWQFGLDVPPGASDWWLRHGLWILAFLTLLLPIALGLSMFERPRKSSRPAPPTWRLLSGIGLCAGGLALLALHGITLADESGIAWLRAATPFAGAGLAGLLWR
jgi:fucose 4-O-acetylase-like acetyltransferase